VLRSSSNGSVRGQIVSTSGLPVSGTTVSIGGASIVTDLTGLFAFGALAAGNYSFSVTPSGQATQLFTLNVAPGASTNFTVTVGASYGTFSGAITDKGLGVGGAIVQAYSGGLIAGTAVADANGNYALWVPAGTYSIRTSAIGRATTTTASQIVAAGAST